ncbi:MAG: hypothetical protein A4E28_01089 [Methanocella sp. PtaU1.Bin125]|nr:MAG: hypothetical protein A4E28_01089 [Methanocella sp. PtaU1.Bin125]
MQLPHGTLINSQRGPLSLTQLGASAAKEELTGYVRVSVFEKSSVRECVVVYATGKPVMAFASEGASDFRDPAQRLIEEALRKDNAIVEVCRLADKQVKLLQDLYRDFAVAPEPAPAAQAPASKEALKRPSLASAVTPPRREEKVRAMPMPEIRGRFVRAEKVAGPDEYVQKYPGETGHLLFLGQWNGKVEEAHIILIRGKIEAAYNERTSGQGLLESISGVSGHAEFYAVDEALLTSIIGRQARAAAAAAPAAGPVNPAPGIGIPAKDLLQIARPQAVPVSDEISRTVDEVSGGMDDDLAMVRKVEREFASHVDELLNKLELSHLRARIKR